jgi:Na+/H+ antiporter NhaD/arsenite permease-like protein
VLAAAGRGHAIRVCALVCLTCALLTAVLSLDGAVVLMVPWCSRAIGLALGALATPHGSVATLVAADRAGAEAPTLSARSLWLPAVAAVAAATATLWTTT